MIANVIAWSLRNRFLVALGTVALLSVTLLSLEAILQVAALLAPTVIRAAASARPGPADAVTILVVGGNSRGLLDQALV